MLAQVASQPAHDRVAPAERTPLHRSVSNCSPGARSQFVARGAAITRGSTIEGRSRYRDDVSTVTEARRRVRIAAGAATLWCAALWAVAMQLTDESRTRIALTIPVLIAGTAWTLVVSRAGRAVALAAAALMMIIAFVAILSVGLLYIPPAIALGFAAGGVVKKSKTTN